MVKVLSDIGPMNRWSYTLRTAPKSLRIFIPVFISYFHLIISVDVIEEDNTG